MELPEVQAIFWCLPDRGCQKQNGFSLSMQQTAHSIEAGLNMCEERLQSPDAALCCHQQKIPEAHTYEVQACQLIMMYVDTILQAL